MTSHDRPFRIVFIGDVHGSWTETDSRFLEDGDPDLAVFLGDLGDEDVGIVQRISEIDAGAQLVMLGNHDAWESFTQRKPTPALNEMLELLGEDHVAFSSRELPAAGFTLIGARPFSWGGRDIRSPRLPAALRHLLSRGVGGAHRVGRGAVGARRHPDRRARRPARAG